jgi:drug/metabolite transporter (DMT)-like permease
VVAILLSLVVFHERLAPRELAGVVLAVLAMLLMKS